MCWILFLDESGHDHNALPYEVHGGVAMHVSQLWPFVQSVKATESRLFGTSLHECDSEIKGSKLLHKDRFKWAGQAAPIEGLARRAAAYNFLHARTQHRQPRHSEFSAYGQSSLQFVAEVISLMEHFGAAVFASFIPRIRKPKGLERTVPRKDMVFLFERFFRFLESHDSMGLLVMDQTEKSQDRLFVKQLDSYFVNTLTGRVRAARLVPTPIFVESDMAYGVQVADVCLFIMNWAYRYDRLDGPTRAELVDYAKRLRRLVPTGTLGQADGSVVAWHGVTFIPDPYDARPQR
jgi:hypothetical protein